MRKYYCFLHWIFNNQIFKISKNEQCKSLIPFFSKVTKYFDEINKSQYLTLVTINESKEKIKKCEELWGKIRDLIMSITKNSDDFYKTVSKPSLILMKSYL